MAKTIAELMNTLPQRGTVTWISMRPGRHEPLDIVESVQADESEGLVGDRYSGRSGKRQVTLIQHEHLQAIASILDRPIEAAELRRNICVRGINLLALKNRRFQIGDAILEHTGLAHPCSFMEQTLGPGGYNAVRGHGGITATVIKSGRITVGDPLVALDTDLDENR